MKYRFVYFSITIFWVIVTAWVSVLWMKQTAQAQYGQYQDCPGLLNDYPSGVAADWTPKVGPNKVLNEDAKGIWRVHKVSWIDNDLYYKQHMWLDADADGIMCENDNTKKK